MFKALLKRNKGEEKTHLLGNALQMMRASVKVDFDFEAYAARHTFNQLSGDSDYGYYYFPYSYLFRYPKWGTLNEMGFRCKENIYEIPERYSCTLTIAIFGGSTGFSILVPDEDTFASQLERMLNSDEELSKATKRPFKVVNLSQPGNVVLNQIVHYVVFCHKLRPEIVISHNGVNDLVSAQISDRTLISKYDIAYQDVLEAWGRKIHDSTRIPIDYDFSDPNAVDFRPVRPKNKPDDVIKSYHARVVQFATLVKSTQCHFISGFQPWITSKGKLSRDEQLKVNTYNPYYQAIYENVPVLYEMYDRLLEKDRLEYVVNLHRLFGTLGDDTSHFGDVCHTLSPGDLVIAEAYYKKIRGLYLE